MWMESTGFGASALLVSLDQTAESVSSDCVVLNYIIHAFDFSANMQNTHNDSSTNITIAM